VKKAGEWEFVSKVLVMKNDGFGSCVWATYKYNKRAYHALIRGLDIL